MTEYTVSPWNAADYLESDEDISAYLNAVLEEDDAELFIMALGDVAKAKGMTVLAREMGIKRESLYKSLSGKSKPKFNTIVKTLDCLGFELSVKVKKQDKKELVPA